jgi:hypothetical protein
MHPTTYDLGVFQGRTPDAGDRSGFLISQKLINGIQRHQMVLRSKLDDRPARSMLTERPHEIPSRNIAVQQW